MKILLVGGAGYIGSHMIKRFQQTDHQIEILDNLSTGYEENVQNYKCSVKDAAASSSCYQLGRRFRSSISVESLFHFFQSLLVLAH